MHPFFLKGTKICKVYDNAKDIFFIKELRDLQMLVMCSFYLTIL